MITVADLRSILADCSALGLPKDIDDGTPIVLDSLAATWIQHLLAERHNIQVNLSYDVIGSIGSVQALHEFVMRSGGPGPGADKHNGLGVD